MHRHVDLHLLAVDCTLETCAGRQLCSLTRHTTVKKLPFTAPPHTIISLTCPSPSPCFPSPDPLPALFSSPALFPCHYFCYAKSAHNKFIFW